MIRLKELQLEEIKPHDVRDEYTLYSSDSSDFRYQVAEDEEFFLGMQLTGTQKDYLLSIGQPPEANNKIRPSVEQVLANVASSSPEWDVVATGQTDNDMANVVEDFDEAEISGHISAIELEGTLFFMKKTGMVYQVGE